MQNNDRDIAAVLIDSVRTMLQLMTVQPPRQTKKRKNKKGGRARCGAVGERKREEKRRETRMRHRATDTKRDSEYSHQIRR